MLPDGYLKRRQEDYDRALCFLPRDVVDFVLAHSPGSGRSSRSTTARP